MDIIRQLEEIKRSIQALSVRVDRVEAKLDVPEEKSSEQIRKQPHVAPAPPPPAPRTTTQPSQEHTELALGGNIFAIIGILSLAIGVIFFYFYAIAQGWIDEVLRVILVLLGGATLVAVGEVLREKFSRYASILVGGGLSLFYISVYMAYAQYELIGIWVAYPVILGITVLGGILALWRTDSSAIFIAMIGGYLTPLLLGHPAENPVVPMAIYVTILNILTVLGAVAQYSWRGVLSAGILASFMYGIMLAQYYTDTAPSIYIIAIFVNWIIFLLASTIALFKQNTRVSTTDVFLVGLTGIVALSFLSPILIEQIPNGAGFVLALISPVYLGLAFLANVARPEEKKSQLAYAAVFGLFLLVAFPIQFDGPTLIFSWASLSLVFFVGAYLLNWPELQGIAMIAWVLAVFMYFGMSQIIDMTDRMAFFNVRAATGLYLVFVTASQWWCAKELERNGAWQPAIPSFLFASFNVLLLLMTSMEISHIFSIQASGLREQLSVESERAVTSTRLSSISDRISRIDNVRNVVLNAFWTLYGGVLLGVGFSVRNRQIRWGGMILILLVIFKMFLIDIWGFDTLYRFIAFIGLGVFLILIAFLYNSYKEQLKEVL